ncbi:hypothetical protein NDU88_007863 [Pleurodeles waltl]|uniref:Uncharacterized protein n=1 Tax=Pleurodeles waltl TaxID=8319 RepID=A0AAV7RW03_PLEWA|nr:hypothetical protein NDU88_007863 [Pleurodeles waltl]
MRLAVSRLYFLPYSYAAEPLCDFYTIHHSLHKRNQIIDQALDETADTGSYAELPHGWALPEPARKKDMGWTSSTQNLEGLPETQTAPSVEVLLHQILGEMREIKISQEEAHRKTSEQLTELNSNIQTLNTWMSQTELGISDLEDFKEKVDPATLKLQTELTEIQ